MSGSELKMRMSDRRYFVKWNLIKTGVDRKLNQVDVVKNMKRDLYLIGKYYPWSSNAVIQKYL